MALALRDQQTSIRVALVIEAEQAGREAANALAHRGLIADVVAVDELAEITTAVIAYAPAKPPSRAQAAQLAQVCVTAALAAKPLVMLAAYAPTSTKQQFDRMLAMAYLRASGALICCDPDVWLETIVLVAAHGLPHGKRVALVTPPDSWLSASANALARQWLSGDLPAVVDALDRTTPVDMVLVDTIELTNSTADKVGDALVVPLVGRAEQLGHDGSARVPLVGLRRAVLACANAGRLAIRIKAGLGRASATDAGFEIDDVRFERQLDKLGKRAGDHESKVLLAAYEVAIVRQAVATTPSAAARIAKKAGYPVELKPWGPEIASEPDGCPVERDLTTAADVRRAYAAVGKRAKLPPGAPAIVRETPPQGREASVEVCRYGSLGWMIVLNVHGATEPVAAPAPINRDTAMEMAMLVEATRVGDALPDHAALADILVRVSHLVNDYADDIERLDLHRVIVGQSGAGAVVVDASATLVRD